MEFKINALARKILPPTLFNALKTLKNKATFLDLSYPVVQIYINDNKTKTSIGLNNFYSCLIPDFITNAYIILFFYDQNGALLLKYKEKICHFSSKRLHIEEIFDKNKIKSELGLVGLQIIPKNPRDIRYKNLGVSSSHFFIFYEDINGSIAQTHPSSIADPKNIESGSFLSNQTVSTNELKSIELLQTNPSLEGQTLVYKILDTYSKEIISEKQEYIPPMGVRKIKFELENLHEKFKFVLVSINKLPSSNSKPLLKRIYKNGLYSMSHS